MAAGNIVKDSKVPAVGTSCTNPQVTANNDYYFRACFIDPFQGTVMANYAFKQGAKKLPSCRKFPMTMQLVWQNSSKKLS